VEGLSDDDLIGSVLKFTRTGRARTAAMLKAVRLVDKRGIDGDIVECGVWLGGNIILSRMVSPQRVCWLYDTFTGMPEPGPEDFDLRGAPASFHYQRRTADGIGWCAASASQVRECLDKTSTFRADKIRFVEGDVEVTLLEERNLPERISVLRLDTDWYASTKVELEVLYPRLAPGGVLIIDDYGHWRGARKAVDDYFHGQSVEFETIDYTGIMMVKA
jgi:O-methyltransferase